MPPLTGKARASCRRARPAAAKWRRIDISGSNRANHQRTIRHIEKRKGELIDAAIDRMDDLGWYDALSTNAKGWVSQVVAGGTEVFIAWLKGPQDGLELATSGFANVPVAAAHTITLEKTAQLVRTAVEAIEPVAITMAAPGDEEWLNRSMALYAREVAFATALVYARVAEQQGANTARASTDLIDALLSGGPPAAINQLGARLGIEPAQPFKVAAWKTDDVSNGLMEVERAARRLDRGVIVATYEGAVFAVWPHHSREAKTTVAKQIFGHNEPAVVAGPSESLGQSTDILLDALAAIAARPARPEQSGIIDADELLAERALLAEPRAQQLLIERCHDSLAAAGSGLLETVDAMLDNQGVLEQAARSIPIHVNTLRYRLDRINDVTGYDLRDSRGALALQIGISLARVRAAQQL